MSIPATSGAAAGGQVDIADVTPEWLTSVLHGAGVVGDARVVSFDLKPLNEALISHICRLELSYDADEEGAPKTLVAKSASREPSVREFAQAIGIYTREVSFYREVAPTLPVATPRVFHAGAAADGPDFLLLMEDLQPALVIDQLEGCTPDQAALAMEQAGALHGSSWSSERLSELPWLVDGIKLWEAAAAQAQPLQHAFAEHYDGKLDPAVLRVTEKLVGRVGDWLTLAQRQRCIWQGDFRLDNVLFDASAGRYPLVVIDWQVATLGPPAADVAFFLGCGMTPESRRAHERDLVRTYHDALLAHGVEDYSWEACWRDYQAHALCGLLGALLAYGKAEHTERGERLLAHLARGYASQIADNDSFAALPGR